MNKLIPKILLLTVILIVGFIGIQMVTDTGENLRMTDYQIVIKDSGERVFTGVVENRANGSVSDIQLEISFYRGEDFLMGSSTANIENLGPDEVGDFEMEMPMGDINGYKIDMMKWFDEDRGQYFTSSQSKIREIHLLK